MEINESLNSKRKWQFERPAQNKTEMNFGQNSDSTEFFW